MVGAERRDEAELDEERIHKQHSLVEFQEEEGNARLEFLPWYQKKASNKDKLPMMNKCR